MPSPWVSWKAGVMILTAVAGIALAAVGYNAPAMPTSIAIAAGGPASSASAATDPAAAAASSGSAAAGATQARGAASASDPAAGGAAAAGSGAAGGASPSAAAGKGGTSTGGTGTATRSAGSAAASTAPATGPLFAQSQYAPYSYQIYPGTASAAAQQALIGFQVSFKGLGKGQEQATITAAGQSQNASFIASDRLYFIEANVGDDGFGQDTNFGDDGFILTNTAGYITNK